MLTAVVHRGAVLRVDLVASEEGSDATVECEFDQENNVNVGPRPASECGEGPLPIMPEVKEVAWGAGAFIALFLLMQFVLYPRLQKGTDARNALISKGHDEAEAARAAARAEVAQFETAIANVKAEANERIEAARATLEAERATKLAEVNALINDKRNAAAAQAAETAQAAAADVAKAAGQVASRTVELATGAAPDAAKVTSAVATAMDAKVSS